jgi:acyl-[acyl-carrier-protein]-phospholipid O-acyltransferase / long-chain-fatty-acid--[acyl-carrier-protein] ligase
VTGSLMKVYEGPALIADRSGATILPVRITGTEYTPFSLLRGQIRRRWFPRITLTVLPPRRLALPDELHGRARRRAAGMQLTDIMSDLMFATSNHRRTILEALVDARRTYGGSHVVAEDTDRIPLSYTQLISRAFMLADVLGRENRPVENVGVLLPGSIPTLLTFLALQIQGRVPAMLNFTAGPGDDSRHLSGREDLHDLDLPSVYRDGRAGGDRSGARRPPRGALSRGRASASHGLASRPRVAAWSSGRLRPRSAVARPG